MEISEYQLEDNGVLRNLVSELQDSLKQIEPETVAAGYRVRDSYTESLLNDVRSKDGQIYLAKDLNRVLGFIAVYVNQDNDEDIKYLFVSDLMVTKSEQGKGIGKLLLERGEQYARDKQLAYIRLATYASNKDAARLYRNMGFQDYLVVSQKKL